MPFRPWLLWLVPAAGALVAGILSQWLAPETRGGGADAIIEAFHKNNGFVRKRVAFVKAVIVDVLTGLRVCDVVVRDRGHVTLEERTLAREIVEKAAATVWQDSFPVVDASGKLVGIVTSDALRTMAANPDLTHLAIAHDLMIPPVSVRDTDDLNRALDVILEHGVRELVVTDEHGHIVGLLDETDITRVYQNATLPKKA